MKIRDRIFVVFIGVIGIIMLAFIGWLSDDLKYRYNESVEETLVDIAHILAESIGGQLVSGAISSDQLKLAFDRGYARQFRARIFELEKTNVDMQVYVTDAEGIVIFHSLDAAQIGRDYSSWNDVARTLDGKYGARASRPADGDNSDAQMATAFVAAPILRGDQIVGVVTVGKPKLNIARFLGIARQNLLYAGIVVVVSTLLLGFGIYRWVSRPLDQLARFADRVSRGERVEPPDLGQNEIGDVSRAVESMREALEGKEYTERYVQALTHELKSPLSAIRGAVELLGEDVPPEQREQFYQNIRNESARMEDLVERMLQLASLEKRRSLEAVETIDLPVLLENVRQDFQVEILNNGLQVEIECEAEIRFDGEHFLLRQALSNLLQNAIDFSPQSRLIAIRGTRRDGVVQIDITDQGPGVPDYASERIFDRFYSLPRPGSEQKSTGLGLNFVIEALELHGGSLQLERVGTLTRARITL